MVLRVYEFYQIGLTLILFLGGVQAHSEKRAQYKGPETQIADDFFPSSAKTYILEIEKTTQKRYFVNVMPDEPKKLVCPARKWTRRAGIIAFLFFLGKGLAWLGVIAAGAYYSLN